MQVEQQEQQQSEEQLLQQEQLKEIIVEGEEDAFKNVQKGLDGKYKQLLIDFWQNLIDDIQSLNDNILILQNEHNKEEEECDSYKQNKLPLARIKKLMKFDNELKMISSETPILFSKVCEVFIQELTLRAWSIVDSDKRRTVQKQDILNALTKSDMYDFLVDITSR
ncbi:histone-fold-containing protein [Hanseniaspora valbyensis NRRL Y-1626]|uniref:Histone-fold-containing protein n=1 Tax=Hanseniaspora valbyensis NRRL Y-1626 TaxID=766949 RepID=A0A1B7T9A7_9ASCO|nr:histone-fold-containing protein [Hanseniaspora valbyensis NRRL Y-1626]